MGLTKEEEDMLLELLDKQAKQAEIEKMFLPQPGPQTKFLESDADIVLFGGAAGAGKTRALLLTILEHIENSRFNAVFFRRNATQITAPGGLYEAATYLYTFKNAVPKLSPRPTMTFPSGAKSSFSHLQYESDIFAWQGAEIPYILWDELTHFSRTMFLYLMSRNRSTIGVRCRMYASTNPDSESWVRELVDWWIGEDGFPIKERSGVVRYFSIIDDKFVWGDSREELLERYGIDVELSKSFTFISASIFDNPALLKADKGYLANLNSLGTVEKGRLLGGNWDIRPSAGMYFPKDKAKVVPSIPGRIKKLCRAWDLAASEVSATYPDPDSTSGVLMASLYDGRSIVLDVVRGQWASNDVRKKILETAKNDKSKYGRVVIRIPQDPGAAGKEVAQSYIKMLTGYVVKVKRVTGDKVTRAEPVASQWQAGNVLLLAGPWNAQYINEADSFPDGKHDDNEDATSDSFTEITTGRSWDGACS